MIFDERIENAKRILTQNRLSEKHPVADAAYIIRYLRYSGESEEVILKLITKLFAQMYYVPSRPDMSKYYKPAYVMANKLPPVRTDSIYISKGQMGLIHSLGDIEMEHFVFSSLCIYKYYHDPDDLYTVKLSDALNVAGVSSIKRIANALRQTDLVEIRQFHNVHYVVISPELLQIDDKDGVSLDILLDLCYYYDKEIGNGKFTFCARCHRLVKVIPRARPKLYCKECARRIHFEQRNECKPRIRKRSQKGVNDKGQ